MFFCQPCFYFDQINLFNFSRWLVSQYLGNRKILLHIRNRFPLKPFDLWINEYSRRAFLRFQATMRVSLPLAWVVFISSIHGACVMEFGIFRVRAFNDNLIISHIKRRIYTLNIHVSAFQCEIFDMKITFLSLSTWKIHVAF